MECQVFIAYHDEVPVVGNAAYESTGEHHVAVSIGQDTYMLVPESMTKPLDVDSEESVDFVTYDAVDELDGLIESWVAHTEYMDGEELQSIFTLYMGGPDSIHRYESNGNVLSVYAYNGMV